MIRYSDIFAKIDYNEIYERVHSSTDNQVRRVLSKETLHLADFLVLLSPAAEIYLEQMAYRAKILTEKHFGKVINMYAPVYLSNECESGCVYCGFNKYKNIQRKSLNLIEALNELKSLKLLGFHNVLLLTGENLVKADIGYLVEHIIQARQLFSYVALEIYPTTEENYTRFTNAGALGLTVYQETYHQDTYSKVHLEGEKKDFFWRLDTPDRALSAGFRKAGIGALLGLHDIRVEAAFLGSHAEYLMKKYWKSDISISFPRLREAGAGYKPAYPVNDKAFVQMLLALRCFLPQAGITLSTRENANLRDNLIGYGVTMMSAGSRTNPGGYQNSDSAEQFAVEDTRSVEDVLTAIKNRGFSPVFKDWDENFSPVVN